jgi:predicted nucleic acid-binding protein
MGLVLDTSVFISGERRGHSVHRILDTIQQQHGHTETAISVVTIAELTHGIYRARSPEQKDARKVFVEDVLASLTTYPLTVPISQLMGRIGGEQAAAGVTIAFPDLAIGATALFLNLPVLTHNTKHFRLIPNLVLLTL